jgi:hypothetical protein
MSRYLTCNDPSIIFMLVLFVCSWGPKHVTSMVTKFKRFKAVEAAG